MSIPLTSLDSWTVLYDDGEALQSSTISGRLSLDAAWAFVVGPERTVVFAVPAHRVIDIRAASPADHALAS